MNKVQLAEKVVQAMYAKDAFSKWLGIQISEVGPGRVKLQMKVRTEMLNGFSVGHGGIAFSLADSALAFASNTHGRVAVSIENSMAYPNPVHAGDLLTAVAEEQTLGNKTATYLVTISKENGDKVGIFRGTVYRTEKKFEESV